MNRHLTWLYDSVRGTGSQVGPAYFIEHDCIPVAVRIHSEVAPDVEDAEFEILRDGVSVMNNRDSIQYNETTGKVISDTSTTSVVLAKGCTSADYDSDFSSDMIVGEAWLTCTLVKDGSGRYITIDMEVQEVE